MILYLFLQVAIYQIFGQEYPAFHAPLKIPLVLSGNFGEIRKDHFHSGIDIKTGGTIGHEVFAIESGYISRIKVQANGYGKAIYLNHPTGHTSVYGHLDRYQNKIAEYVRRMQYRNRSHEIDLYLKKDQFQVEKGEVIAYSGNTGGSSGPHLHFEIRTSRNQHPVNVLKYPFPIDDGVAPVFHSIRIYSLDSDGYVNRNTGKFHSTTAWKSGYFTIPGAEVVKASGNVGISVEVFDYLNGAANRCGVYTLSLYLDESLVYQHSMDEFSFNETRYVNAHIDYRELMERGTRAHCLHRKPNDRLRIYKELENNGVIFIKQGESRQVRIVATDVAGNNSELRFTLTGDMPPDPPDSDHADETMGGKKMKYDRENRFTDGDISIILPANTLYEDLDFAFSRSDAESGSLTDIYHISTLSVPVHARYSLSITPPEIIPALYDKLCLIHLDVEGDIDVVNGDYENGIFTAYPREFGSFALMIDTLAPQILPLGATAKKDMKGAGSLRFSITDDLSGIEHYEGYLDNQWVLFEYDMKNDLLFHTFDRTRTRQDSAHELELYVTDAVGNVQLFHQNFTW